MTLIHLWELVYDRWWRGFITRCDECDERFRLGVFFFKKGGGVICDYCYLQLKRKNKEISLGRKLTDDENHQELLKHCETLVKH